MAAWHLLEGAIFIGVGVVAISYLAPLAAVAFTLSQVAQVSLVLGIATVGVSVAGGADEAVIGLIELGNGQPAMSRDQSDLAFTIGTSLVAELLFTEAALYGSFFGYSGEAWGRSVLYAYKVKESVQHFPSLFEGTGLPASMDAILEESERLDEAMRIATLGMPPWIDKPHRHSSHQETFSPLRSGADYSSVGETTYAGSTSAAQNLGSVEATLFGISHPTLATDAPRSAAPSSIARPSVAQKDVVPQPNAPRAPKQPPPANPANDPQPAYIPPDTFIQQMIQKMMDDLRKAAEGRSPSTEIMSPDAPYDGSESTSMPNSSEGRPMLESPKTQINPYDVILPVEHGGGTSDGNDAGQSKGAVDTGSDEQEVELRLP